MMAETEEVSKVVGIEAKCGLDTSSYQDLPKPACNGINHHNKANDLDNSYVFVSGADGLPVDIKDVVAESCNVSAELDSRNKKLDAESGKISDPPSEEVNVNVDQRIEDLTLVNESSLEDGKGIQVSVGDSLEEHTGKTESLAEAEVEQIEDPDINIESFTEAVVEKVGDRNEIVEGADDGEQEKFDELTKSESPLDFVENQESQIGVSDLVAGSGESGEPNNISPHVNSSGNENGEYGNEIKLSAFETSEACQGSQDVVVGGVECELQDVSVGAAEDEVKLAGEVVETHEVSPSTSLDLNLESNPINTMEEKNVVEDVVECELQDVRVKAEDEVKLSGEVVETAEHEVPLSTSLDLESTPINTKEEIDVVMDLVECELQDQSMKPENEVKSSGEVVEIAEHETPPSTSLDFELNPINTKEETDMVEDVVECESQDVSVKAEDEIKLSEKMVETEELEISPSTSLYLDLDLDLESTPINTKEVIDVVEDVVECELHDQSMKGEDEVKLSGEVVETVEHEVPQSTSLGLDMESNPISSKEETSIGVDVFYCELQDVCVKAKDNVKLSGEVVETEEHEVPPPTSLDLDMESYPINTKEEKDVVVEVVECESQDVNLKAKDEVRLLEEVIKTAEHEVLLSTSLDLESNSINSKEEIREIANVAECELQDASFKAEDKVKLSGEVVEIAEHKVPSSTSHVTLEPEVHVHSSSAYRSGENSGDVTFTCRTDVSDSSNVDKEGAANIDLEIEDVEDSVDQIDGAAGSNNENLFLRENEDTENPQDNNTHAASSRGSRANMIDREEASIKTKRKPFNFLIRVPRFDNESLREQIRLAKLNIDEKTKLRDAIQVQIQKKRASTQIHGIDYEYAKGEGRIARKLVRSKRMEIDSIQSVINKAKNALSIEDIASQINNMEHMIQHETLPLKEEKQLIREIKQLKQLREQLSYNMGNQDEIKQALEQRKDVEERLKILRKELDILKDKVLKSEAAAVEAEKKYDDENKKVKELQAQFRTAADARQAAYVQWQSLRKELSKKSEHFFKYKDDAAVASNYVFSRDTEALYRLCTNNVENFMELWNTNDEFRREYVKFNARSTVRRLGTLDGRPLGPNEEPHILPSYVDERIVSTPVKVDIASQFPTLELKQERTIESVTSDGKLMRKVTEEKNQKVTNKGASISMQVNDSDTVSGLDITHEVHEEPKKSRGEIEAIKKAEEKEIRKEAEAKLKEQRRLEALAKANEARERKKRQAEKLQMRAELKTLKEAEQKEKEREKRLRKKERKKADATDVNDINNCEIALISSESAVESRKDLDVKDVSSSSVTAKKPKKHWLFGKQGKAKSIPPPLRNRNKKKLQQWIWVGITSIAILVLFWLGNIGVFSNVHFKRRSHV